MIIVRRIDVANLAGVSEATVSRVFNNVKPLREETKQKVLEAARLLNYQPNALAQSFATGKSGNIGVIVPYLPKVNIISTHYFSEILGGIGMILAENNYNLLLIFQSPQEPKNYIQLFNSQKIDGCIILGSKDVPGEKEEIDLLQQFSHPYCLVNQTFEGRSFYSIDAEHYKGSFEAVSLLLNTGFRKIAFLNGPSEYSNSTERLKGYQDALTSFGIEPQSKWIFQGNYSRTSGYQTASKMAGMIDNIDAVFSANDRMAIGLMQGLNHYGYRVGRDYALIGYDDSDVATIVHPPLSSVHVPLFEMGKRAAESVLNSILKGHTNSFQEKLPVTLVERDSTNLLIKEMT